MSDPNLFRLRVVFAKRGRLALLSHLELARALERAVRRANLPFAVSKGYSPHMRIAFGAALPVGVGGSSEIFDILLTRYVRQDEALSALQQASVSDLMCLSCSYVEPQAKAASVAYPFSVYQAVLTRTPVRWTVPDEIVVIRKKKERALHPIDFLVGPMVVDEARIMFALEAKDTGSLRPDLLIRECCLLSGGAAEGTGCQGIANSGCAGDAPLRASSITRIAQCAQPEEALQLLS